MKAKKIAPSIIIKLMTEEEHLRQEIEQLKTLIHQKNDKRHAIKQKLKDLDAGEYARIIRSRMEESWEVIILTAIKAAGVPIRIGDLLIKIKEIYPQLTEEKIKANIYHKSLFLKKEGKLIKVRKPKSPGEYFALPDLSRSKLTGFTRVR